MAIFANMVVKTGKRNGEETFIQVPIVFSTPDRVAMSILSDNVNVKAMRLPTFCASIRQISLAPELRHGVGVISRQSYVPLGGVVPTDIKTVEMLTPVPYKAEVELGLFASNIDQYYQLLEQILLIFDPVLQIQTTDAMFDSSKITTVILTNIQANVDPAGVNPRVIQGTLTFEMPVWLSAPVKLHDNVIKTIKARVAVITDAMELALATGDSAAFVSEIEVMQIDPAVIGEVIDEENIKI